MQNSLMIVKEFFVFWGFLYVGDFFSLFEFESLSKVLENYLGMVKGLWCNFEHFTIFSNFVISDNLGFQDSIKVM